MRIIDELKKQLTKAASYNPDVQVAPACVLWPDKDKQWDVIISELQGELPSLFVLGEYNPDKKTGPAIWLRCVIDKVIDDIPITEKETPILYLPGYSRHDLRAIEECPNEIKPLAELQYRGTIWSQLSTKDWTILAFLKSDQGGLGLDVTQDNETKQAMKLSLPKLIDQEISLLQGKQLDKDYFNKLLMGGDPVKDLLLWLNDEVHFKEVRDETAWDAFVQICKSQMDFDPQGEGVLNAAVKLANHTGPWKNVWERYIEAPTRYPNIPDIIRKNPLPPNDLFSDASTMGGWPQWNDKQEEELRKNFISLENETPEKASEKIIMWDERHKHRRNLVWADLGEANCAEALKYLSRMILHMANPLAAGTIEDLKQGYEESGWLVEKALLRAMACIGSIEDYNAITIAIQAIYPAWVEQSSLYFQKHVYESGYPGETKDNQSPFSLEEGLCVLFVDGLRYDTGKLLDENLGLKGYETQIAGSWAALPTITATGKVAVSPIRSKLTGDDDSTDFETKITETGQSLKGGYHFKKLMEDDGWTLLGKNETGTGEGKAWCEYGDLDHEGHDRGWKLSGHIPTIIQEISDKIDDLLNAGWKSVRVVTDHGWLFVPRGLPKTDLPAVLTDSKWGRCASIKTGATTDVPQYPWYWNSTKHFALADGISCFKKGLEYTHGGLSLQECYIPELTVSSRKSTSETSIRITDIKWRGLRCKIAVDDIESTLRLDVRMKPGDPSSSVVLTIKDLDNNGMASVIVEDEDLESREAFLILLNSEDSVVAQVSTVIGGSE